MKNIPGIEPEVTAIVEEEKKITRLEQEKIEQENKKLDQMVGEFYKPDYKVYIFKGEEMYNEEFLAALDNSPTYSRSAQELEKMISIFGKAESVCDTQKVNDANNPVVTKDEEDDDDDNVGLPVFLQ